MAEPIRPDPDGDLDALGASPTQAVGRTGSPRRSRPGAGRARRRVATALVVVVVVILLAVAPSVFDAERAGTATPRAVRELTTLAGDG